jgi:hypothetical protein
MGEGWVVEDSDTVQSGFAWVSFLPWGRSEREFKFACKTALLHKLEKLEEK